MEENRKDLKGSLDAVSFAEILNTLCRLNREGVLTVFDDKRKKVIYFRDNGVTLIGGTQRVKIGDMLLNSGKIDPRELNRALAEQKATGRLLGEIVVDQGLVTAEQIEELIAEQIEEEICDLFFWENSQFTFQVGPLENTVDTSQVSLSFDVRRLLFRIADKIPEWENIRRQIPSFAIIFVPSKNTIDIDLFGKPESRQNFERVLSHLNGANDVFDIIRQSWLPVLSVCRILLILLEENAIRRASFEELIQTANELAQKNKNPKQIQVLEQALALRPNDEQLLLQITHAYENIGIGKKTAECYVKLGNKIFLSSPKDALKYFERAIAHAPDYKEPYTKMLLLLDGQPEQEIRYAKKLLELYMHENAYAKVEQLARKYVESFPDETSFLTSLAKAYEAQAKTEQAIQIYENLADMAERHNDINSEISYLRKILEILPTNGNTHKRVQKLEYYLRWGRHRHIIMGGILAGVLLLGCISFIIYYEMGARKLYNRAKQSETVNDILARKLYEDVLFNYPNSTVAESSQEALDIIKARLGKNVQQNPKLIQEREQIRLQQFEHLRNLAQMGRFSEARSYLISYRQEYKESRWQKMCDELEMFINEREEKNTQQEIINKIQQAKEYRKDNKIDDALALYKSLNVSKFPELSQTVASAIDELQKTKVTQTIKEIQQKFQDGNREEKSGNFTTATEYYKDIENLARCILEIPNISDDENREISHLRQLGAKGLLRIEEYNNMASIYIRRGQELEKQGKIEEAHRAVLKVIEDPKLGKTHVAEEALLPFRIETLPRGARIKDFPNKTPTTISIKHNKAYKLDISYTGFEDASIFLSSKSQPMVEIVLKKKIMWEYPTVGAIWGNVAQYRHVLVVASRSGKVSGVSSKDGRSLWEYQTRAGIGDVESSATIYEDTVYFGANDSYIYALDLNSGKLAWEFKAGGFIHATPLVDRDAVFSGNSEGKLYCLHAKTGKKIWEYECPKTGFHISPVMWSNSIIGGNGRGEIIAWNNANGSILWTEDFANPLTTEFVIASKNLYFTTLNNYIYCWDLEQHQLIWKTKLPGQTYTAPEMLGSVLYIATSNGTLCCISRTDGKLLWSKKICSSVRQALAIIDDLIYIGSGDAYLYIVDKNGELVWKNTLGLKAIRGDISYNDSCIFIGTEDGILYALMR